MSENKKKPENPVMNELDDEALDQVSGGLVADHQGSETKKPIMRSYTDVHAGERRTRQA